MGATSHFTVTNTAWSNVTVATRCRKVTIGEDPSVSRWPTTDFLVAKPTSANAARRVPSGQQYQFSMPNEGIFNPGDVIAQVELVQGASTTFFQDESDT
jgi:hypothetical protein